MLDNRDYMRAPGDYENWWTRHPAYLQIIVLLAAVFAFDQINLVYLHIPYERWLFLTPQALTRGHIWQLLTFQFFHAGFFHQLFNCIVIYFFGQPVEERLGRAHFLKIYFLGGIAGGILQAAVMALFPIHFGELTVGASAGAMSALAAFALMDPGAPIRWNFIITIPAVYLLYAETAISLFFTLVPTDGGVAHAAHLGGIAFTWAYMRWDRYGWFYRLKGRFPTFRRNSRQNIASLAIAKVQRATSRAKAEVTPQEFISAEVDPILDKISAHGIQSLTDKEREILQSARRKMSRH